MGATGQDLTPLGHSREGPMPATASPGNSGETLLGLGHPMPSTSYSVWSKEWVLSFCSLQGSLLWLMDPGLTIPFFYPLSASPSPPL